MSIPGFTAEAAVRDAEVSLVPAAIPVGIACVAACVASAVDLQGTGMTLPDYKYEEIVKACAAICGVPYTETLMADIAAYWAGGAAGEGSAVAGGGATAGGAATEGGAAAGGIGAGGAAAIAAAAAAVAWMLAKIGYSIWWEEMPLPPPPPAPPSTPVTPPSAGPCQKFLTNQPEQVTGYGSWSWLESGCAGADRSAYAKAAAFCNTKSCSGTCRTGGPCHPDYIPVDLTRAAGWSLGFACSSTLTFHCACAC